jgi:hypothetical protein
MSQSITMNQEITNKKSILPGVIQSCESFSASNRYPAVKMVGVVIPVGYSQCLASACVEMSTAYTNSVVEIFESILKFYLFYSLKEISLEVCSSIESFISITTTQKKI